MCILIVISHSLAGSQKISATYASSKFRDVHKSGESIFPQVFHSEVRNYWDSKPCNSGWQFDNVEFGTHEYFEKVETKKVRRSLSSETHRRNLVE